MRALGYALSDTKHVPVDLVSVFGGVTTSFARLEREGLVELFLSESRRETISLLADEALARCTPALAASLRGKVWWCTEWASGRVARAALQALTCRANLEGDREDVGDALREALEFIRDVLIHVPPKIVDLTRSDELPVLIWSDAMYERGADIEDGGGWLALFRGFLGDTPRIVIGYGMTPRTLRNQLIKRKAYSGQLELVWGASPYLTLVDDLAGKRVIHFIDNTGAITGFVKGYARPVDSAKIVMAMVSTCVAIGCSPFFVYVRSKANIADLPSRFGIAELMQILRTLGWASHVQWVVPAMPDLETWRSSAREWAAWAGIELRAPSLPLLRGRWRHLVTQVVRIQGDTVIPARAVYVGRNPGNGLTRYGNWATVVDRKARNKSVEHERCVRAYAVWLYQDEQADLRAQIRMRLVGKRLACHCPAKLACHAEILAVCANEPSAFLAAMCASCAP
jgi:hypothetical protein